MLDKAIATLSAPNFESEVRTTLASWDGADPAAIDRTIAWVAGIRADLVTLLKTIDEEQAPETLAINYIEIKTRWIALNTKVNYQTFRTGGCEPEDAFRGSAISALLAQVETLLTADDIGKITEFLSQPITRIAA